MAIFLFLRRQGRTLLMREMSIFNLHRFQYKQRRARTPSGPGPSRPSTDKNLGQEHRALNGHFAARRYFSDSNPQQVCVLASWTHHHSTLIWTAVLLSSPFFHILWTLLLFPSLTGCTVSSIPCHPLSCFTPLFCWSMSSSSVLRNGAWEVNVFETLHMQISLS